MSKKKPIDLTAQERLSLWARVADDRSAELSTARLSRLYGDGYGMTWVAYAECDLYGMKVVVESDASGTAEVACVSVIDRLAEAGVVVP